MTKSIVYLIGAGPGSPDLITVRGLDCLKAADVVLYDHAVHPRLLAAARPGAERIDVGKAAPQPLEQEAICYLLAEKAREGKVVARLKWGDPFLFDSGGPEALFLHEQQIRFEVVPGIPAGIGAPSHAGIPLTYPGGGDTVTFVRGHEGAGPTQVAVDWASLAQLEGTIVCYVGADQIPAMVDALIEHGRPGDEPSALVYDGTVATQTTVTCTLAEVPARFKAANRRSAMLVIGRVTALRDHLRWFDSRPLFGKRVLVTRPREQSADFVALLEALGAQPIEAPMISIAPPDDWGPLDDACQRAGDFDWIVFSSGHGVDYFFDRLLSSPLDLRALKGVKLCAVGPSTAERMTRLGLKVDLVPAESKADAVVQAMVETSTMTGARVLLPRADIGREVIAEGLRRHGADVTEVVAYRTVAVDPDREGGPDVYRMLLERDIDVVTFTSPSAVRNFVEMLGAEPAADLLKHTDVASIGPVTAEAAAQLDIHSEIVPAQYTIRGMVDAIVRHYEGQR